MPTGLHQPGMTPGILTTVTSVETQITAHPAGTLRWDSMGLIRAATIDAGNTPTSTIRGGLVLAMLDADIVAGTPAYREYNPIATDGRERARGVLQRGISMLGPDGIIADHAGSPPLVLNGGWLKTAELLGFDAQARMQLSGSFQFDDEPSGQAWMGAADRVHVLADAAATLTVDQSGGMLINSLFTATRAITLPAIGVAVPAPNVGLIYRFAQVIGEDVTITSTEGNNIIGVGDIAGSTVTLGDAAGGDMAELISILVTGVPKWLMLNSLGAPVIA